MVWIFSTKPATSVVDPKLFIPDPDPALLILISSVLDPKLFIPDLDPASNFPSSGSGPDPDPDPDPTYIN